MWVEGFVAVLACQPHHRKPCLVTEDDWFRLCILGVLTRVTLVDSREFSLH